MVVIDASVAAKWYLPEVGRAAARALLLGGEELVAPDLIVAEVLNVMWKNVGRGLVAADHLSPICESLLRSLRIVELAPLASGAAEIAVLLNHPIYDCFYLALAERERCTFVTADERLYRRTRRTRFSTLVRKLS